MIYFLISLVVAVVSFFLISLNKGLFGKDSRTGEKIFAVALFAVFIIRYFSLKNVQLTDNSSSVNELNLLNIVGNISLWLEITAILMTVFKPFFGFKTNTWYAKYISFGIFTVCLLTVPHTIPMIQGSTKLTLTTLLYAFEVGFGLGISTYNHINDKDEHILKRSYFDVVLFSILINFATMPSFILNYFLGDLVTVAISYNFSLIHIAYLFVLVLILPFGLYFLLRNRNEAKIRYILLFITFGMTIQFFGNYDWKTIFSVWDWPLNLGNLAMILLVISLVFKPKKLFYFVYFFIPFGAFIALLFVNDASAFGNIFDSNVVHFWCNYLIATWMPLLCVALKLFERPKLKDFFFSSIWYAVYFVFVLVVNTLFKSLEGSYFILLRNRFDIVAPNYFIVEKEFVENLLGDWSKSIIDINVTFNIGSLTMVLYPVYQGIYLFGYFAFGLLAYLVYLFFIDVSDSIYNKHIKSKGIRLDHIAIQSHLNNMNWVKPDKNNPWDKLEVKNFSKRYPFYTTLAVNDINIDLNSGEVFGILGPTLSGKSCLIKCIAGIQPIRIGDIFVCGYNLRTQTTFARNHIGFVPDHYVLPKKMTGKQYLTSIADLYDIPEEVRENRFDEYVSLLGLKNYMYTKISDFSNEIRQKIAFVAAIINEPKILVLDEIFKNIDDATCSQLAAAARSYAKKGNIVVLSAGLKDGIEKVCDRIMLLDGGRIDNICNVSALKNKKMTAYDLYASNNNDEIEKILVSKSKAIRKRKTV